MTEFNDRRTSYHVQSTTGMVHTDPNCSVGTARHKTVPSTATNGENREYIKAGRLKECKKCGPTAMGLMN